MTSLREQHDWLLHLQYTRNEFGDCLARIETLLKDHQGLCEYPIYLKALMCRHRGEIAESLALFQAATCFNPQNLENVKQIGRSLYLLGKHEAAIDVYLEAQNAIELSESLSEDWSLEHDLGLCYKNLGQVDQAISHFHQANAIQRHDATFSELGELYLSMENFEMAIETYTEALEFTPDSPQLLTALGLAYLRQRSGSSSDIGHMKAFEMLGNAMTHDPRNPMTILAAGSIIQEHQDMDVALIKYRVAAVQIPGSAELWNNIGMCFFGKQRFVAAIACLKRGLYLDPLEWTISYNLGLIYLNTGQYASAFHYFSGAINLKSDFAPAFMYLGITLSRLDDFDNATQAYDKALALISNSSKAKDPNFRMLTHLNYAITLSNNDELEASNEQYQKFEDLFQTLDPEIQNQDFELLEQRNVLMNMFLS